MFASCALLAGCRDGKGPKAPSFDPSGSAQAAIEAYDTDGDGQLNAEELRQSPALAMSLPRTDANGDGALSADEIADRITYLQGATAVINGSVEVFLDGKSLEGATVTLDPEPFMGDALKASSATTNDLGRTFIVGHDPDYPGIWLGFYKVRISKKVDGKETLPAKYNTETELGLEAADDFEEQQNVIQFHLESN
jgi:hypothetical protein